MTPKQRVLLGTRGSRLALTQAEACASKLRAANLGVEIRVIKTTSDHHPETPLSLIDRRDVFTRQLDESLLSGEIDLAVHSLKDVPTGCRRERWWRPPASGVAPSSSTAARTCE
jgi:hydroxymethylbilane synthase